MTVDDAIRDLRLLLGCDNDAQLARSLCIDNSTISSWRARGKVPEKYLRFARGEAAGPLAAVPEIEMCALALALLRFVKHGGGPPADFGDFLNGWEIRAEIFPVQVAEARRDIFIAAREPQAKGLRSALHKIAYREFVEPARHD